MARAYPEMREFEPLQETAALNASIDPLTGVYNRTAMLSLLFRETDRVQRMKTPLCLMLFGINELGDRNSQPGAAGCDDLLGQVVRRVPRLLRSYDMLGRTGKDEFLVILPGCITADATTLAERLHVAVFAEPFQAAGEAVRISACFGIASSEGRSPVVVLREAEQALQKAKQAGPGSIECFNISFQTAAPVGILSPGSGDAFPAR